MRLNGPWASVALVLALIVAPVAAQTAAPPAPVARTWARYPRATEVQLRDVAAFVRVTPENRNDIAVSVRNSGPLRAPEFRMSRQRLIIDGKLRRQIRSCRVRGEGFEVVTARQGSVADDRLPTIELRVPQDAVVTAGGAVRLHISAAQSVHVRLDGCGDADIERVEHDAEITISGPSDARLYDAGTVTATIAGPGDVTLGHVRSGLTVSIAGAGGLIAARADGDTSIAVQGSGDVLIRDGRAESLTVVIAGSGDVTHNGVAGDLNTVILGGGDVRVRRVEGAVSRRVLGAGDVIVGH